MVLNDLKNIKGIGPSTIEKLKNGNIHSIEQLANTTATKLTQIEGVGTKSANKWISAAKEFLNKKVQSTGIITKTSIDSTVKPPIIKDSNSSIIYEIQSNIRDIFSRLNKFEDRLNTLENKFSYPQNTEIIPEISQDHFLRIIKNAYNSINKSFGEFVPIDTLTESIKHYIPWSTKRIHHELYKLFTEYKIDLQPGKGENPLEIDGKKFVWFKLK